MHPEMEPPPFPSPHLRRPVFGRPVDPVAAVVGNATAFGLGYALMRRPGPAAAAIAGTVFLLFLLAGDPGDMALQLLFGSWWLAMCLHAWHLTRDTEPAPLHDGRGRERVLAIGAAGLIVLVVAGLRFDARHMVGDAEAAHAAGECERAVDTLDQLHAGHRVAHGDMVLRGQDQLRACRLLNEARAAGASEGAALMATYMDDPAARWDGAGPERAAMLFDAALDGRDLDATLKPGFEQLIATLEAGTGSEYVRETVERLMAGLAEDASCDAVAVDDWIRAQSWEAPALAEPIAAAAEAAPLRLLDCARDRAAASDLSGAQEAYQRFVAEYPDHADAQAAVDELDAVDSRIEFEHVQRLLTADEYCQDPAPWRDAPAYEGPSPHPMWMIGLNPSEYGFSEDWIAQTVEATEIVVCVDGPKQGRFLESCYYEGSFSPYINDEVSFYAARFDVKVFALRTGEQVDSYTVQFDGNPCPEVLEYSYYYTDLGPPSEVEAEVGDADVRSVFERLQD
ncbi:hypothetical protein K3N28_23025 [Glycomyces sp. TRM65418]|uniref:hypothetical protein n=1 Tax=Glycomyces sp. TRM65418 TaxID=2867006 RepID=UPI001CE5A6BE|nr:hypothetical protein [Glycomyces sp. TRM65418]MCC3765937.1 hypothetical protein [Glycomyces sp. TRM65418]QZD55519.1 hypothetical protein K3N28_22900 [Glycomyces sp. TRM65418]